MNNINFIANLITEDPSVFNDFILVEGILMEGLVGDLWNKLPSKIKNNAIKWAGGAAITLGILAASLGLPQGSSPEQIDKRVQEIQYAPGGDPAAGRGQNVIDLSDEGPGTSHPSRAGLRADLDATDRLSGLPPSLTKQARAW